MTFFQAVVLGILQGLTEFLPISSSGHLVIGQKLFGFSEQPVLFDILIHLGTLLAVLVFFRKQFLKISSKTFYLVLIGTIPAIFVGFFLNKYIQIIFDSFLGVGISLLITSLFLFSTKFIKKKKKEVAKLNWKKAFIIGCFQAFAILPGVSRSGSTVIAGLWQGLERETTFNFSFYLAVPAMVGAFSLQLPKIFNNSIQWANGIGGFITAAIFGFLSLTIFKKVVLKGKLFYFGIYCFILGLAVLLI